MTKNKIKAPIRVDEKNQVQIAEDVAWQLIDSGTYIPTIKKVIFNRGEKAVKVKWDEKKNQTVVLKTRPILTTIVMFADRTKVIVSNSIVDGDILNKDGEISYGAKERGLIYAVMKRMIGYYDEDDNGEMILNTSGLGKILRSYIDNAVVGK